VQTQRLDFVVLFRERVRDEAAFNNAVAKALIAEFGRLNVGYVTPEPVVTRKVTVTVETEKTTQEIVDALNGLSETQVSASSAYAI
jgi:hypothetical protein